MATLPLNNDVVVDLQSDGEDQLVNQDNIDENAPLIPSSSSCSVKKMITAVLVLVFISGVIFAVVWQSNKSSVPPFHPTNRPGPSPVPTIRPLPKNASDMSAENLLYIVFDKTQLLYTEIICLPQLPRVFKVLLQVENYGNFSGESNSKNHARIAVSREAAHKMFQLDYSHKSPIPPPPSPCQIM